MNKERISTSLRRAPASFNRGPARPQSLEAGDCKLQGELSPASIQVVYIVDSFCPRLLSPPCPAGCCHRSRPVVLPSSDERCFCYPWPASLIPDDRRRWCIDEMSRESCVANTASGVCYLRWSVLAILMSVIARSICYFSIFFLLGNLICFATFAQFSCYNCFCGLVRRESFRRCL
jgi:hypothetical protein